MTEGIFLYYIPGKKYEDVTASDLAANPILAGPFFDLIHSPRLFKSHRVGCTVDNRGPDNGSGCIVGIQPQVDRNMNMPHYNEATQTWRQYKGQFIGWQTDMMPGPESLRRPTQISGYEVELGDGRIWNAPTIRPFHEDVKNWGCSLPSLIGIDENGEHTGRVIERYRSIWETSRKIADVLFNGTPANPFGKFDDAVACLSLNYKIGAAEATILELFTTETINAVTGAAVDNPMVEHFLSAQVSENPTTRPGSAST